MKKKIIVALVMVGVLALGYINWEVYPFTTKHPNFSDVERVFNKMQFPSDWKEIDSSENRGIAGRACPIDSGSACYHKAKTFTVSKDTDVEAIKSVFMQTGCPLVGTQDHEVIEGDPYTTFLCSVEGMKAHGSINYKKTATELYISVVTE